MGIVKDRRAADDLLRLNKTPVGQTVPFFCPSVFGLAKRLRGEILPPTVLEVNGSQIYLLQTIHMYDLIIDLQVISSRLLLH